jgi:hypothetical protein
MLVVESVVPGSPSDGVLEPGDVLVRVDGEVVTHFLHLEELLDARVGQEVVLELERGGVPHSAPIAVVDLHCVTPSSMLELAGGSVHALSYQQARNNKAVVGQVYVAEPGYMLGRAAVPKHAIITALDGKPTPDLQSFAAVLRGLLHRARVPLEYYTFSERHRRKNAILQVDRQWYGAPLYWERDDAAGAWHPTADYPPGVQDAPSPPALTPVMMSSADLGADVAGELQGDRQMVGEMDVLCNGNGKHEEKALSLDEYEDCLRCSMCLVSGV